MHEKWTAAFTAVAVGYNTFFLFSLSQTVDDTLVFVPWDPSWYFEEKQRHWIFYRAHGALFSTCVPCMAFVIAPATVTRYSLKIFQYLSIGNAVCAVFIALSGAGQDPADPGKAEWAHWFTSVNWSMGISHGFLMSFGIPIFYGVIRRTQYARRRTLLGAMVVAMLAGDLVGFFAVCGFDYTTAMIIYASCVALAPLFASSFHGCMLVFDMMGDQSLKSNSEARRRLRVLCVNKDFAKRLAVSSLLYFLVDFPRTIWIVFLNQLFKRVAEDPSEASTYAIIGLAVAIACSAASVLYKYFTRFVTSTPTDVQDLRLRKSTASLYVVFGFIFLVILFVSGLRDSESTEFAGLGFVGYFAAQALTMKSLLEFLPDLFDDDTFAVGWMWTFCCRA
ncbi:hypothetical protein AAVH_09508 [Aphelenchoides avenae]|nr:hypothetical protein AAVH_09508 [Aphelenchus avenae]